MATCTIDFSDRSPVQIVPNGLESHEVAIILCKSFTGAIFFYINERRI